MSTPFDPYQHTIDRFRSIRDAAPEPKRGLTDEQRAKLMALPLPEPPPTRAEVLATLGARANAGTVATIAEFERRATDAEWNRYVLGDLTAADKAAVMRRAPVRPAARVVVG